MSSDILHQSFCVQMLGTEWRWVLCLCSWPGLAGAAGASWCFTHGGTFPMKGKVFPLVLTFTHAAFATRVPNPLLWASCSRSAPWSKNNLFSVSAESWDCWLGEKPQRILCRTGSFCASCVLVPEFGAARMWRQEQCPHESCVCLLFFSQGS